MEQKKQNLMEMIDRPAFIVRDGIIAEANQTAKNRMIPIGAPIHKFLPEQDEIYSTYTGGILHLTLEIGWTRCGAIVIRQETEDIFLLDRDADQAQLQTLALAAQQLRTPLSNVLAVADTIFPEMTSPDQQEKIAQMRQSLFQIMRILCNMSDAERYSFLSTTGFENTELCSFLNEIVEQIQTASDIDGINLHYNRPSKPMFTLIDREQITRAVYNLVSNAIKFSPSGSDVKISISSTNRMVRITVEDHGEGIADHVRSNLFHRYLREPAIEDSRFGLGLGMSLIRSVAAAHSGAVLIEEANGTRVTMSLLIQKEHPGALRSPLIKLGDYAGGYELNLLEFAETLPSNAYKTDI